MNRLALLLLLFSGLSVQAQDSFVQPDMILVKGGTFSMGSNQGKSDEQPVHTVLLKDFYIGKYEVTQALWQQVMQEVSAVKTDCPDCAVYDISYDQIQVFLERLNKLTGNKYRLPTEAEWEYAATGGAFSKGYKYSGSNDPGEVAWYEPNADKKTHPVGQKLPNELGIYDMSGNVWELCSDWYDKSYYKKSPEQNPVNTQKSTWRVVRGGSWRSPEQRCQVHARNRDVRDHHISNGGFRLVMEIP